MAASASASDSSSAPACAPAELTRRSFAGLAAGAACSVLLGTSAKLALADAASAARGPAAADSAVANLAAAPADLQGVPTNADAAVLLAENADAYNPQVTPESILAALDSAALDASAVLDPAAPDAPASASVASASAAPLTNASAALMVLAAFGPLPEPHYLRVLIGYHDCAFEDVPADLPGLADAVQNLTTAGIWIPADNARFEPDAPMDGEALRTLVDRIHAYLGASLRDDFCNTVNHDRYYEQPTFLGEDASWVAAAQDYITDEEAAARWYYDRIEEAFAYQGDDPAWSNIAAFFSTWDSMEGREQSLEVLAPYTQAIERASTADELLDAMALFCRASGVEIALCGMGDIYLHRHLGLVVDDEGVNVCCVANTPLSADVTEPGTEAYDFNFEQYSRILEEYGFAAEEARERARGLLGLWHEVKLKEEELVAQGSPSGDEVLTVGELQDRVPGFPLASYLERAGLSGIQRLAVENCSWACARLALFDDDRRLEAFKTEALTGLLMSLLMAVPARLCDRLQGYYYDTFSEDASLYYSYTFLYYYAIPRVQWDLCAAFEKTDDCMLLRERTEQIRERVVEAYRAMLAEEEWMAPETRTKAVEKLDAMSCLFMYPDQLIDGRFRPRYTHAAQGGTLVENIFASGRSKLDYALDAQDRRVDDVAIMFMEGTMSSGPFAVPIVNGVFFPLGSLIDGSLLAAQDLSGQMVALGHVLAHEITHLFDGGGRLYGPDGVAGVWWTPEDDAAYDVMRQKVEQRYAGVEYGPGLYTNPDVDTTGECMSDLGAMSCAMRIAAEDPGFDYDAFFRGVAGSYAFVTTRDSFENVFADDVHPVGRARVNPALSSCPEFYETYGLQEGDWMWWPPEKRLKVW